MSVFMTRILIVAAMVGGTMLTRFLPFLLFPAGREVPPFVEFLSRSLPYASMALLVVYCLKDITTFTGTHGIPELTAVAVTAAVHWFGKNSLLSIAVGTVLYMILVQMVFI